MPTTIQVSEEVRQQIEGLKRAWGLKSCDEVIKRMIRSQTGGKESYFGAARGSRRLEREAEDEHDPPRH